MSGLSDYQVIHAIFTHSNSAHERSIARQIENAAGADRSRLIAANRSLWLHYERIAREENRKGDRHHKDMIERLEKKLPHIDFSDLKNLVAEEELKRRGH